MNPSSLSAFRGLIVVLVSFFAFSVIPATTHAYVDVTNDQYGWVLHLTIEEVVWSNGQPSSSQFSETLYYGDTSYWVDDVFDGGEGSYDIWGSEYHVVDEYWEPAGGAPTPPAVTGFSATSNYGTHYVFNATDDVTSIGYANYGGRFLTLRALDPYGNNIADSFNVRWRVTEQITGTVLHNWSIEPSVTLYDLGVDKSFRIEAQSVNSSFAPWQAVFNFRAGYYAQADSGPDNVFPYKGQRGASCFLACLRNLIYMLTYGQQAPTEDELIDILFNVFGKSKESWSNAEDENHGTPDTHVVLWGNHILGPYGLTVTRQSYVTKADMAQKLRDNKVLIVYTEVRDPNQDPNSLLIRYVTHAIVLYKGTNGTIYVFDPNYGPVPIGDPDQNPPNFTPRKDGQGNDIPADAADQAVWNIKMYSKQIINGEVLYDWSNLVWEVSTN